MAGDEKARGNEAGGNQKQITVEQGDSLYKIAMRYAVTVDDLLAANPELEFPGKLEPGQTLLLPEEAREEDAGEETAGPEARPGEPIFLQTEDPVTRIPVNPEDVELEPGYVLEPYVIGLTFPTSLTFDDEGTLYIGEAGFSYGPARAAGGGRILRVDGCGQAREVASGFRGPVTGVTWHEGWFYVAEGAYPGRILRVDESGRREVLVDDLPTAGDHYTSNIVFGPDGKMYFGVGTLTNSAVVGPDNRQWLLRYPERHDIPSRDYLLRGENYRSLDVFDPASCEYVSTGAFHPYGVKSYEGEVVEGRLKANGVILRANPDGSGLEKFADGFRNPFALGFSPDGKLYTIDHGYDDRGSRPIANAPDPMWEVEEGGWYGFPDFAAGIPVTDPRFAPPDGDPPEFVLKEHPPVAERLVTAFAPHAAAMKFDFAVNWRFGYRGQVFVALFGADAPFTGQVEDHPGHRVVRVDPISGEIDDFLVAHRAHEGGDDVTGPVRPIEAKFSPCGKVLYVLDFGRLEAGTTGLVPWAESGILWRVRRV